MTQQLDLFRDPAPSQMALTITPDNALVLVSPSENPTGAEAAERRLARLREVEDRRREKKGMVYA